MRKKKPFAFLTGDYRIEYYENHGYHVKVDYNRLLDELEVMCGRNPTAKRLPILLEIGCRAFGVSLNKLLRNRKYEVTHLRHKLMAMARLVLRYSYYEIGRAFGCDHTTVYAAYLKYGPDIAATFRCEFKPHAT